MKKITFLIVGFIITNSYAMDCEECWNIERSMSHSIVARISMAATCRKMCESQSNLDAGRGYHTDAESMAYICATNYGNCQLGSLVPQGYRCGCYVGNGTIIPGITR